MIVEVDLAVLEARARGVGQDTYAAVPGEVLLALVERCKMAEGDLLRVAQAMGYSYAPDTGPDAPAPTDLLVEKAREHALAASRVAELEEDRDNAHRQLDSLSDALDRVRELEDVTTRQAGVQRESATRILELNAVAEAGDRLARATSARLAVWTRETYADAKNALDAYVATRAREVKS